MTVRLSAYSPAAFTHQEILLVLISVRGCVDSRAVLRPVGFYINKISTDTNFDRTSDLPIQQHYVRIHIKKYMWHNNGKKFIFALSPVRYGLSLHRFSWKTHSRLVDFLMGRSPQILLWIRWKCWKYILTHSLHGAVLLEQLTGLQLVKKFPAFHGTRRFITALTSVRHLYLSWASRLKIRSKYHLRY